MTKTLPKLRRLSKRDRAFTRLRLIVFEHLTHEETCPLFHRQPIQKRPRCTCGVADLLSEFMSKFPGKNIYTGKYVDVRRHPPEGVCSNECRKQIADRVSA